MTAEQQRLRRREWTEEEAERVAGFPSELRAMYRGLFDFGAKWIPNPDYYDPKDPETFKRVLKDYWRTYWCDKWFMKMVEEIAQKRAEERRKAEEAKRRAADPQLSLFT